VGTVRHRSFWWGVSLALPPALLGLPAVGYGGSAIVNIVWHLTAGHDSPERFAILGGLAYGLAAGPLLQCIVVGAAARVIWPLGPWRAGARWLTKIAVWVGSELVVVPVSLIMTTLAYAVPTLLGWSLRLGDV
jgi:hypothetical protein